MVNVYTDEENIIHLDFADNELSGEMVKKMGDELEVAIKKLKEKNFPVLILADISSVKMYGPEAQSISETILSKYSYDKMATFGANRLLRGVADSVVWALGIHKKVHNFGDKSEALQWLTSDSSPSGV